MNSPLRWNAAKMRQLRYTGKKINEQIEKGVVSQKLYRKLERQWNSLTKHISFRFLSRALSGAALMLVLGSAQGQITFGNPIINPWSYTKGGSNRLQSGTVADLDNDGDFDLIVSDPDYSNIRYYENVGTSTNPSFAPVALNPFGLIIDWKARSIHFADMDNDGDMDVFTSFFEHRVFTPFTEIKYQENIGTASAPSFSAPVVSPFGIGSSTPLGKDYYYLTTADLDNDGDKEVAIGEDLYGKVQYFDNTGSATAPAFAAPQTNLFSFGLAISSMRPAFVDLDADGDLDLLLASDSIMGVGSGYFQYLENTGSATSPVFGTPQMAPFNLQFPGLNSYYLGLATADMDGDGDEDLILIENEGTVIYYENTTGNAPSPNPVIQFSGNSLTVDEPTAGTINVDINITNPTSNITTAAVRLSGASTASRNSDFIFTDPTQITFPPNSNTPLSLSIPILDDNWVEPDETIILELINPGNNASFGPDSVFTITIRSEDFVAAPPEINFTSGSASVNENSGSFDITAALNTPVSQQVEVTVASGPLSTAVFGQDYTLSANRFIFPPNSTAAQSITVNLINDPDDELDELLSLRMINPIGGVPLGDTTTFNLEILDDDYAVGLEQLEAELGLRVSPNPASSFVDIRLNQAARLHCSLMDMQGKNVLQQDLSGVANRLDLAGLSAGVYLLRIASAERSGSMKLIIR